MGTIGNTLGGYYQLSNLLSSGSGTSTLNTSSPASVLQSLEQELQGASSSSGSGSSYLLDLSPTAQALLNGNSASTSSASGASSTEFTLSSTQEAAIKSILEKYKDAPLTQATFNDIQNALQAAGLSPETLGAEDQVSSFNPTNVLIQALGGNYTSIQTPDTTATGEQTKETNYMQNIVSLWKSMDSTTSSASGSSGTRGISSASGSSL